MEDVAAADGLGAFAAGNVVPTASRYRVLEINRVDSFLSPDLDLARIGAEDDANNRKDIPRRYAIPKPVSITPAVEARLGVGDRMAGRLKTAGITTGLGIDVVTSAPGDMFNAMRAILVDKRRAAARFLRAARGLFPNAPGGDLLRAAEAYGYSADAAAKGGVGEFNGGIAMRFIDQGHRRAWAKNLDAVRENDGEAREALASARQGMR